MTVRSNECRLAFAMLAAFTLLFPLTAITDDTAGAASGTLLRGVLSNGDLVLEQKRTNEPVGSSGSGLHGSSGSGLRGSSGSGLHGSSGSGLRGSSGSGLHGSSGSGLHGTKSAPNYISIFDDLPLLAIGPVSEISADEKRLEVLGQSIVVDDSTSFIIFNLNGDLVSTSQGIETLRNLEEDDYVAVAGDQIDPGLHLGTIVVKLPRSFVDGASPAFARVILDLVDLSAGRVSSGKTLIDITATLYNPRNLSTHPGNIAEYFGYSYTNHKSLVATNGNIIGAIEGTGPSQVAGSSGSGLHGSSGSGLHGSSGSGFK